MCLPHQLKLPDEDVLECVYNGYDIAATARALHSDINLVALKIAELNRRGYQLREQEISEQIPEIMRLLPYRLSDKRTQDIGE